MYDNCHWEWSEAVDDIMRRFREVWAEGNSLEDQYLEVVDGPFFDEVCVRATMRLQDQWERDFWKLVEDAKGVYRKLKAARFEPVEKLEAYKESVARWRNDLEMLIEDLTDLQLRAIDEARRIYGTNRFCSDESEGNPFE